MQHRQRCHWVTEDPLYITYHDTEWGVPVYDDQKLFAMLNLEGQQAGLSWITVLKKRDHYHTCFFNFNAKKIISIKDSDIEKFMQDPGLIRHRLKLNGIVKNAYAYLNFKKTSKSFSDFLWSFVENRPMFITENKELQAIALEKSIAMSKALKKLGFTFVGATICYAFMQATGMLSQHDIHCHFNKSEQWG